MQAKQNGQRMGALRPLGIVDSEGVRVHLEATPDVVHRTVLTVLEEDAEYA